MPPFVTPGGRLDALIRPAPGRLGFALRMALICGIITFVIEIYQLPSLATTVYASFFIFRPNRGATILSAIVMPLFITITLLIALLITATVLDHPFWRVMAMALFSFTVLFLGSASKLKPFAATMAVVVGYTLDLLGGLQIGELATRALLYAWFIAAIPGATCIAVALLTGPAPRRLLERSLAERLQLAAASLRPDGAAALAKVEALLRQGDAGLQGLLSSTRSEHSAGDGAEEALARAIDSTMAILSYVTLLARSLPESALDDARLQIAAVLDEMADIMRQGGYPIGIVAPSIDYSRLPTDDARLMGLLGGELAGFAEGPGISPVAKTGGFMLPDAFTNPAHVRLALKTTAAAMFCYFTFQQLDWAGIHTSLITCFVVSLGSAGETIEKLTLRICGCLVGAAFGFATLVFIVPHIDDIVPLVAIITIGTIPAAWVVAGGPSVSYAGLQVAFAFYLTVLQGPSPQFDLSLGRDRIIGVIFGNLMVYVLFTKVWPVSICADVDPAIARLLRALSGLATAGREGARHRIGAVRNAVGGLRQELRVARYEPISIRPADSWLDDRERALKEIDALQAPLFAEAAGGGRDAGEAGRRLEALARRLEGGSRSAEPADGGATTAIEPGLISLEKLLGDREPAHAIG